MGKTTKRRSKLRKSPKKKLSGGSPVLNFDRYINELNIDPVKQYPVSVFEQFDPLDSIFNTGKNQNWQPGEKKPFFHYCSPGRKINPELHYSCLDNKVIDDIIDVYNKNNKTNKITGSTTKQRYEKFKEIRNFDLDACVVKTPQFSEINEKDPVNKFEQTLAEVYFKIPIPKGKYEWLSNFDIDKVMTQYERRHPHFAYLVTAPMDFQTVKAVDFYEEASKINMKEYIAKGINTIGIVLNLDHYGQPGSHWVCCFIDLRTPEFIRNTNSEAWNIFYKDKSPSQIKNMTCPSLEFFDSVGSRPPPEISKFFDRIQSQVPNIKFTRKIGNTPHQKKNSECGNYCLLYIISRLRGVPFETFNDRRFRLQDEWVNQQRRDVLFLHLPNECSRVKK
jgi:hypothetical protein